MAAGSRRPSCRKGSRVKVATVAPNLQGIHEFFGKNRMRTKWKNRTPAGEFNNFMEDGITSSYFTHEEWGFI
jgi:hypothetical protein